MSRGSQTCPGGPSCQPPLPPLHFLPVALEVPFSEVFRPSPWGQTGAYACLSAGPTSLEDQAVLRSKIALLASWSPLHSAPNAPQTLKDWILGQSQAKDAKTQGTVNPTKATVTSCRGGRGELARPSPSRGRRLSLRSPLPPPFIAQAAAADGLMAKKL